MATAQCEYKDAVVRHSHAHTDTNTHTEILKTLVFFSEADDLCQEMTGDWCNVLIQNLFWESVLIAQMSLHNIKCTFTQQQFNANKSKYNNQWRPELYIEESWIAGTEEIQTKYLKKTYIKSTVLWIQLHAKTHWSQKHCFLGQTVCGWTTSAFPMKKILSNLSLATTSSQNS